MDSEATYKLIDSILPYIKDDCEKKITRLLKTNIMSTCTWTVLRLFREGTRKDDPNGAMWDWIAAETEKRCIDNDIQAYMKERIEFYIKEHMDASCRIIAAHKTKKHAIKAADEYFRNQIKGE